MSCAAGVKLILNWLGGLLRNFIHYLKYTVRSYFADDLFFYGSALSFQVILCLIPTIILIVWILSTFLSQHILLRQLEIVSAYALPRRIRSVDDLRRMLVARAEIFTRHTDIIAVIGLVGFFWTSLGLVATLRKTVFQVLGIKVELSFIRQTLYDLRVLLIAGFFLTASILLTALFALVRDIALQLPHGHVRLALLRVAVPVLLGFGLTFLLYFTIYRFLSYGRLRSAPAAFGAFWAALLFELAKNLFALYITRAATLTRVYGTLEAIVGLMLWIFYSTTVFVIGAELAKANSERRMAS